jgi:hypothetical protein
MAGWRPAATEIFSFSTTRSGVNNGGTGAKANAGASVVINNSMFTRNQVGLAFAAGGALASTKTNLISGSLTSDSAPSAFITLN